MSGGNGAAAAGGPPRVEAIGAVDLRYAYPDGRVAVDGVTLSLGAGESLGLIGPSGAGKTTLILLLAGLLEAAAGMVRIFSAAFGGKDDAAVRRRIGLVFEETRDQLFSPTVFEDVAFGPLHFGLSRESMAARVAGALARVGLGGYEGRVPQHLSSGERRRAALATVLAYDPDILILDEPSSDLDPRGRRELIAHLKGTGQARIVASHDLEFVLRTCARTVVMEAGRIRADGPTVEILADGALLERHGLEAPLGLKGLGPEAIRGLLGA